MTDADIDGLRRWLETRVTEAHLSFRALAIRAGYKDQPSALWDFVKGRRQAPPSLEALQEVVFALREAGVAARLTEVLVFLGADYDALVGELGLAQQNVDAQALAYSADHERLRRTVGRIISLPPEAQIEVDDFSAFLEARALRERQDAGDGGADAPIGPA